jgi:hypothetical protein
MSADRFDELTKALATGTSRRRVLKALAATVAGGAVMAIGSGVARADPQTCVVCQCGTGNPCNVKSTFCTEVRGFPAEETCANACAKKGQNLCSAGQAYHCPRGCS